MVSKDFPHFKFIMLWIIISPPTRLRRIEGTSKREEINRGKNHGEQKENSLLLD